MKGHRFLKTQRVLTNRDYREIYASSQRGGSALFNYHVQVYPQQPPRIGITVSKKVSNKAVDRNRIKRQVKEFYRLRQNQLKIGSIVITAKPASQNASDSERYSSLEQVWEKILKWQAWYLRQHAKPS